MMFYKKEDIDQSLTCFNCGNKFDQPLLIVPCCETLCLKCVNSLTAGDDFNCCFCNVVHNVPRGGFKLNMAIDKLLKSRPGEVCQKKILAQKNLTEKFNTFKRLVETFSFNIRALETDVDTYCSHMQSRIDLAAEEKIEQIKRIRTYYLKHTTDYKTTCLNNIEQNKPRLEKMQTEFAELLQTCEDTLSGFETAEDVAEMLGIEIDKQIDLINTVGFNKLKFTETKLCFGADSKDVPLNFLGIFTLSSKYFARSCCFAFFNYFYF